MLGLASTTRGFAFAVLEGRDHLVDWGLRRTPVTRRATARALRPVLLRGQPGLIAIRGIKDSFKRHRGRLFFGVAKQVAEEAGVHLVEISKGEIQVLADPDALSKWDVAHAMAQRLPKIAGRLPPRRKPWQSEDDRIGLFLASAAAFVAWERFGLEPEP